MTRILFNELQDSEAKLKILNEIVKIIDENKWNQTVAAQVLGVDQPKISQIKNGKIAGFSLERLLFFLTKLNCKIEIKIER